MATPFNPGAPDGPKFKPVRTNFDIVSGARSKVEGSTVHPSGRTPLNLRGTKLLDRLAADAGQNIQRYNVQCEADDISSLVAVSVATDVGPGVTPVRRTTDGRTVTIHLGGVFEENPLMRPATKRQCQVWLGKDSQGRPSLIISVGTGLGTRTNSRPESEAGSDSKQG